MKPFTRTTVVVNFVALLAVLEHWFMVLPLPDEKLWRWMMPARKIATPRIQDRLQEDPHGL